MIFLFLFIVPLLFYLIIGQQVKTRSGSDQFYHRLVIDLIKGNKHRFIREHKTFLNENIMSYPQLFHWCVAFLPEKMAQRLMNYFQLFFSLSGFAIFFLFVNQLYPYVQEATSFSKESFLLFAGLLFITIPYSYNLGNAKNAGLSARGLGLFLGQAFLYGIVLYTLSSDIRFLYIAAFAAFLVVLTSQFASQYVFFSTPLLALLYGDVMLFLPLLLAIALFFLIAPRVAYRSFKGQIGHKILFSKYLAVRFILDYRYSIWKDFFYELPARVYHYLKKPKEHYYLLKYLRESPMIIMLTEISLLFFVLFFFFTDEGLRSTQLELMIPILVSVLLFLIFSFRATRFLGEPERYVEFSFGLLGALALLVFSEYWMIALFATYGLTKIILEMKHYLREEKRENKLFDWSMAIKDKLLEFSEKEAVNVLSNGTFVANVMMSSKINQFLFLVNSTRTDRWHFNDLHSENYDYIDKDQLIPLVKDYNINYLVIDTTFFEDYKNYFQEKGFTYELLQEEGNLSLLKCVE